MKKRWKLSPPDSVLQGVLGKELNILPSTAQLLINRGISDPFTAYAFLSPELKDLHDPFLMKDMARAAERVISALANKEKIAVYGDYDVDGTTSTAVIYLFLKEFGADMVYYLPDRLKEGYGLNVEAIKKLKDLGVKLIITVDCGASNQEEVIFAASLGIDTIVTDHHVPPQPGGDFPAYAFLNPLRTGCAFPFKGLSGVGVAFNFIMALRTKLRERGFTEASTVNLKKYLDIVAVGTVSDMVPLVDENRIFASWGLRELNSTGRPGLKALKDVSRISSSRVSAEDIAFKLAPRINAAGRLGKADAALKLLITDDPREAAYLANKLDSENSARQAVEEKILKEALGLAAAENGERAIVLFRDGWHPGVVGIVASKIADKFSRPALLIAFDGEKGKGSARGIKGANVLAGLKACSRYLTGYGGHEAAAGLSVTKDNINDFKEAYLKFMRGHLSEEDLSGEVTLDCAVGLDDVNSRLVDEIERLAPFGRSNERPLFYAAGADLISSAVVGEKHLKMKIRQNGRVQSAIAFGKASLHPLKGSGFDLAFCPYLNEWQGVSKVELRVKELKPAASPEKPL